MLNRPELSERAEAIRDLEQVLYFGGTKLDFVTNEIQSQNKLNESGVSNLVIEIASSDDREFFRGPHFKKKKKKEMLNI